MRKCPMPPAGDDNTMALEEKVFKLDKRIRYCGVLDERGKVTSGGMRPGVKSLEPDEEAERIDLQVVLTRSMSESAQPYLGRTNYVIIHRENVMFVAMPRKDRRTILVSTEPSFPLAKVSAVFKVVETNYPQ